MSKLPIFYLIVTVLLASAAQVLQKKAAKELVDAPKEKPLLTNNNFMFSGVLLGISLITWLQVLSVVDVSVAYPLLSLNYVLVLVLANWILGETVPRERWIGVACIVTGVVVLSSGSNL